MEHIADGFALAEGPVITPADELLVSDVLNGGVRRFAADGSELEPLLDRRRGIGGMGIGPGGLAVVSGRDLSRVADDGTLTVLAEQTEGGTGFNDLVVTSSGDVIAGMLTCHPMGGGELTPGALVQIAPAGDRTEVALTISWPNGMGLSPGGDTFYLSDFETGVVHAGAWTGSVADLELEPWFVSPTGDADGLAIDDDGHIWLAGGVGRCILHVDPDADLVERIDVPGDFVSSCCFWPGRDRLVITTGTGVVFHTLS